ncbi:MAG: T9SS type A sorting domain-containing protein [Saprospiraceae bacterium]|nr:T9SS type A sorting domain-containing protein [Saprospiraceae bacterium]
MALQTVDPGGVRLAGSFTNWTDAPMTDQGNGVWSITLPLTEGTSYQYKFKNGPNGWEQAPPACGVDDGFGGYNRGITVGSTDVVLPSVCFSACGPCAVTCDLNPDAIICDNFESYNTAQKLGPQATHWTTWSGTEGTNEDGIVTTEQASSPTKSLKIVSTSANGGPQDVVLNLGNKTSGHYELKWKIFVGAGKNAYYNIQNAVPIPASPVTEDWNLDVFFENNGSGRVGIEGVDQNTFTFSYGEWLEVRHDIDLDNDILDLYIGGAFVGQYPYPDNLGGIDFYGTTNVSTFYIDDVEYVSLPAVVYNVDFCESAVNLTSYFGAAPGVAQTTGIFDNTNATAAATDPEVTCWNEAVPGADIVDGSMWYSFVGDGNEYHIETVPCDADNYIGTVQQDPGDTQMLIYSGDNCDDLTEIACNDDLFPAGDPDWRSGLDLQTESGQKYYMLIDGFNFQGTLALGEYCIEITQLASVTCADGQVGTYSIPNPFVCFDANIANQINLDDASFVLPTEGPIAGMGWALSQQPIDAGSWPVDQAGFVGGTGFGTAPFAISFPNDGSIFPAGVYYLAPVVLGGGTIIDPAVGAFIFNVDPSNGCFFVGASTQVLFLPLLDDVSATTVVGTGSIDLTPAGGFGELVADESFYVYQWSNGATTQDLSNLSSTGTYTCTVSDITGCALEAIVSATVTTVGVEDPASVQAFTIVPNPTTGAAMVSMQLAATSDVRIEVMNTLGQSVQTLNLGKVNHVNQQIDLGSLAQGTYLLRATVDGETAIRRVVVQR